jgi:methionyl-tRNA formyltransferase
MTNVQPHLLPTCDFLLVVDFGYYIPDWLIHFPRQLAINVHPSALPQYRGASPGQYVIKNGDSTSAVSLITLAAAMDAGDLLAQIPFAVCPTWTTSDYYTYAFQLITCGSPSCLAHTLTNFTTGAITMTPQIGAPTFAPKITKADAFIPWTDLNQALHGINATLSTRIERHIRAFQPWPLAWTLAPTTTGEKRLQLLTSHLKHQLLILDQVKLEGDTIKSWATIAPKIHL